jgi:hypothetical protein
MARRHDRVGDDGGDHRRRRAGRRGRAGAAGRRLRDRIGRLAREHLDAVRDAVLNALGIRIA